MTAGGIVGVVTPSELARDRMIEIFYVTQFRRSVLHQGTDERLEQVRIKALISSGVRISTGSFWPLLAGTRPDRPVVGMTALQLR